VADAFVTKRVTATRVRYRSATLRDPQINRIPEYSCHIRRRAPIADP
jgi:hypothetical protein